MELGSILVLGAVALLSPLWFGARLQNHRVVWSWAVLALLLLALAGGIYWSRGTYQDVRLQEQIRQQPDDLRQNLIEHLQRWPDRAGFRYALTQLLADADEWSAALEQLDILTERYPSEVSLLLERLSVYMRVQGVDENSARQMQVLLSLAPKSPGVLRLAGLHALAAGERDQALHYWSQLIERLPEQEREQAKLLLQRLGEENP